MAASYGGLAAYKSILAALPAEFPLPILLVQHRRRHRDFVAQILSAYATIPIREPQDGDPLRPGTVFVLPPDRQATVTHDARLRLAPSDRCLADPVLESSAFAFGDGVTAVILTGQLNDGAAGVRAVKRRGGRVLAQDAETAERFGMPGAAIATGCVDFVLPLRTIAAALVVLTMVPGGAELFRVRIGPWADIA